MKSEKINTNIQNRNKKKADIGNQIEIGINILGFTSWFLDMFDICKCSIMRQFDLLTISIRYLL